MTHNILKITGLFLLIVAINNFNIQLTLAYSSEEDISTSINYSHNDEGSSVIIEFCLNNFSAHPLRGFYYSDNIPTDFELSLVKVEINGTQVEYLIKDMGNKDDVYPGRIPYRWIIETPPNFLEDKPINEKIGTIKIVYSITPSNQDDSYDSFQNNWVALLKNGENETPVFGYNEAFYNEDSRSVGNGGGGCFFITTTTPLIP